MALLSELRKLLGPQGLIESADQLQSYSCDWSGEGAQLPIAVARPANTAELAALLQLCNTHKQPVVTQGGLTGLSGGATPLLGELAVSTSRMRGIVNLDKEAMTCTVRAGTPLEEIQLAAQGENLLLALDLGARGNCSIGGNISTNAGGNQVIRYGMARAQVLGLEAVRADGTIVRSMNTLLKNNTGYDLKHQFIGTEGSLGIITECVLRLHPQPKALASALCACSDFANVIKLLRHCQREFNALSAFEVMWSEFYETARKQADKNHALSEQAPFYVLLEAEHGGSDFDEDHFLSGLQSALDETIVDSVAVAQSSRERADFWAIRDAIGELLQTHAPLANFDIGLPIGATQAFSEEVAALVEARYPKASLWMFGHLGDGNLHVAVSTGQPEDVKPIVRMTLELAAQHGGVCSAEHGIGMNKKPYLALCRSAEEIDTMRSLKRAFDPNNILNPGRIFDL